MKAFVGLRSLVGAAAALLSFGSCAQAADWQDFSIGMRYGTKFHEPNVAAGADIEKFIWQATYANRYAYGSNFFNVDYLKSDHLDPARCSGSGAACTGAQEFYMSYRHDLSLNKVTGTQLFTIGPFIKDIAIRTGFDANSKDTSFAPAKRLFVAGPQLQFNVPVGFFNVAFNYSRENNNNGIVGKPVHFDPALEIESAWNFPFQLAAINMRYGGFANYIAPKGKDGFNKQTKAEFLSRSGVYADIGEHMKLKKGTLEVGVGYEYWVNKFGNDPNLNNTGTKTQALTVETKVHF
jgi:hypothetical protein